MRAILAFLLLALSSCAPGNLVERPVVGAYQYTLGTGDKLRIATYGEQRLSGDFAIDARGRIQFPLLGDIPAGGMTIEQFKDDLLARLGSQLLRNPEVTVDVLNFRPVYLLGEVSSPGEFAYSERMSVYALVAKAGGFTFRADQRYAYIRGENDAVEQAVRITSATAVKPGDTIRIPERTF